MNQDEKEKNKIMDYSKFFEEEREKKGRELLPEKKKKVSLSSFKNFWSEADKKTKIEMIVFLVVVIITLGILIFYFLGKTQTFGSFSYPPSQRVDFSPSEGK